MSIATALFFAAVVIAIVALVNDQIQRRTIAKLTSEIASLKETAALNKEAFQEVSRDARQAWEEVAKLQDLNQI